MEKYLVKEKHWLSERDYLTGLALAQMLPGATFVSLVVYGGYKVRGLAGALTGFFAFLTAPFVIMLLFSHVYFTYGLLPEIGLIFHAMAVIVTGILAQAVITVGRYSVTDSRGVVLALAAAGMQLFYPNIFLLLLFSAAAGVGLYYPVQKTPGDFAFRGRENAADTRCVFGRDSLVLLGGSLVAAVFLLSAQKALFQLAGVFFKMGFCLFGGGFSMLPFIQQEVVNQYHWLTVDEFFSGIALSQVTPGPVTILAAFAGYKAVGFSGAVVATLAIYLPSLFLVVIAVGCFHRIENNPWIHAALQGVRAAFAGMIAATVAAMMHYALQDQLSLLAAAMTFIVLEYVKLNIICTVFGGTALYYFILLSGK